MNKDNSIRIPNLLKCINSDITIANCLHLLLTEEGVEDWIHPSRTFRFVSKKYFLHLTWRSGPKLLVKHEPGFFVKPHPATYALLFCILFCTYNSIFKIFMKCFITTYLTHCILRNCKFQAFILPAHWSKFLVDTKATA